MKLLTAVDQSESSTKVINESIKLAKALSAQIYLVHVLAPDPQFLGMEHGTQSPRDILERNREAAREQTHLLASKIKESGVKVESICAEGYIPDTILDLSIELNADMIIIGSHGHGAVYQMLVGSVSEAVLHKSEVPVLVIPTHSR